MGKGRKIKTATAESITGEFKSMKLESLSSKCHECLLKENLQATTILFICVSLNILKSRKRSIIYSWNLFKFRNIHSVISATRSIHFYRNENNFALVCNTHTAYLYFLKGCYSQPWTLLSRKDQRQHEKYEVWNYYDKVSSIMLICSVCHRLILMHEPLGHINITEFSGSPN